MSTTLSDKSPVLGADRGWRIAAIALLAVRFVQGWIYWGGGTRRFIYGPQKLDVHGHWMAYKFQTAMPGALLGTNHLVAFLLNHFTLLYAGVIIFSAVEMIAGFMLIAGLWTRLAAVATIGLSTVLLLLFGWQGATCIDEWTMAASNFGMGVALFLAGSGAYSIDNWLLARKPSRANSTLFRWFGGSLPLPLSDEAFKKLALGLFLIVLAFVVGSYSYYRGSVITPFHGGPVSPAKHHWQIKDAQLSADGGVRFHAYVDAGVAAEPSNALVIRLLEAKSGKVAEQWLGKDLAQLPKSAFHNDFPYQQLHAGKFGIVGPVGASATISLPGSINSGVTLAPGNYLLEITSVNNHVWKQSVTYP